MNIKHLLPLGLSVAVALSAVVPAGAESEAKVPSISHEALVKAISAKKVVLLDVNGTESYKSGHIPGAIDFETAQKDLKLKLPANKEALIVAYCGGPMCGAYKQGAQAARKLGYTNVRHYSPGISGWQKSGARVAKG